MRGAALVGLMGVAALAAPAHATPEDDLRDAENSYLYGDYPRVITKLEPLVEPDILLAGPDDLARAYELLGLSTFFLDRPKDARMWFERLIRFRPDMRLNPVLVPPPAVSLFDDVRESLADEIARMQEALRKQRKEEEERKRLEQLTRVKVETQVNSRLVASLPFGIGQFQNDQAALGYTLLATQVAAGATSIGCFVAIENMRQSDGFFDRSDVDNVRTLQQVQLWTGGAALVLMVGGVIHAWLTFRDEVPLREIALPPAGQKPARLPGDGLLRWTF